VIPSKANRIRGILVGVLVVLSCLAIVVTGVAWWTHYSVFDSDGYIELVAPLGKDPEAIGALSDYVAAQVVTATDLQQRTEEALPPEAKFLAGPITGAVNEFIAEGTNAVLSTPEAYELWIEVNRVAHEGIVALLRGETTNAYIQGDEVRLNTLPLISEVLVWLDGTLPGALSTKPSPPAIAPGTSPDEAIRQLSSWLDRPLPANFGQITLLQNESLGVAQTAVRWFDALIWVLLAVTIVLLALTIWLSRERCRTLIELGIGAAIALVLTYVIVRQVLNAIVGDIQAEGTFSVLSDVAGASVGPLRTLTIWVVVLGVIVAVVAWVSGRRDVQVAVVTAGKRAVQTTKDYEAFAPDSPITDWVTRYSSPLRIAGLVAGLLALLFVTSSWLGLVAWVVAVLVFEGLISLFARQWPFGERKQGDGGPV
jgi:hypothetical protein